MGTAAFFVIHIVALLFFPFALILTIPLHIIYAAVSGGKDHSREVRCPACQEFVHMDARICPHCRSALVPYFEQRRQAQAAKAAARSKMSRWERFIRS